jgi:AraC-like DNA-binding protein
MGEQIAQHVVGVPAPPLRAFVSRYTGYRYEGFEPGVHVGMPSQHLTFIVSLGDPIDVGPVNDQAGSRGQFAALVGGLHTQPAAVHHDGSQYGIQLDVTPLGARALFGMPASQIATLTLPLDTVLGRVTNELVHRLHDAPVWSRRFAVIDQLLLRTLRGLDEPPREVTFAWDRLTRSGGTVEVGWLATEVGWSRRHLSEQFRKEFGLPPKTLARVVRFDRARRMLMQSTRPSLGWVAAAAGYADQAHMTRDWREFVGASPTTWMAAEQLPFFQDGMDELAPDSQA